MKILKRLLDAMPNWRSKNSSAKTETGEQHLNLARESLLELVHDERVPEQVRTQITKYFSSDSKCRSSNTV